MTLAEAAKIAGCLSGSAKAVGVFVSQTPEFMARAAEECGLSAIQLHGGISSECADLPDFSGCEIWRAVWLESPSDVGAAEAARCSRSCRRFPFRVGFGGTGKLSDWGLRSCARKKRLVLAGGISPENAAAAVRSVNPWAVDANSMVEENPRSKDLKKMETLIEKIKNLK